MSKTSETNGSETNGYKKLIELISLDTPDACNSILKLGLDLNKPIPLKNITEYYHYPRFQLLKPFYPLSLAVITVKPKIVKCLLNNGANPELEFELEDTDENKYTDVFGNVSMYRMDYDHEYYYHGNILKYLLTNPELLYENLRKKQRPEINNDCDEPYWTEPGELVGDMMKIIYLLLTKTDISNYDISDDISNIIKKLTKEDPKGWVYYVDLNYFKNDLDPDMYSTSWRQDAIDKAEDVFEDLLEKTWHDCHFDEGLYVHRLKKGTPWSYDYNNAIAMISSTVTTKVVML
jgi:hypothetical protein